MKTIRTATSSRAGTVEVACDDPQGWDFGASASVEDGRDVVAVRLSRADDAPPPASVESFTTRHYLFLNNECL